MIRRAAVLLFETFGHGECRTPENNGGITNQRRDRAQKHNECGGIVGFGFGFVGGLIFQFIHGNHHVRDPVIQIGIDCGFGFHGLDNGIQRNGVHQQLR